MSKHKYFLILLKINIQIKKRKEKKEIKKEQKATPASLARAVPPNNDRRSNEKISFQNSFIKSQPS